MQLGWIDFSKEDRQKAFDVINLLSEQGAVDELGIGVIRDAFANYFFPGTSTIQTRAKYFLIVPYMLTLVTRRSELGKLKASDVDNFTIYALKDEIIDGEEEISDELADKKKQDIHAKIYLRRKYSDVDL